MCKSINVIVTTAACVALAGVRSSRFLCFTQNNCQ